ncbi:terminase small subunit domain protein [Bordetella bronchiseptica MBORD707]|nr:terminase small subunit domain protein [Bordetella bronchiseptica MBORD707]
MAAEINRRRQIIQVRAGVTPEMVVAELAKLGFADILQVVAWKAVQQEQQVFDQDGEPVELAGIEVTIKDSADISPEAAAAISEITQSKDGTLKVKMHDKLGALARIGQYLGMFRAPASVEPPGKKKEAQQGAANAQLGSDWEGLLPASGSLQ